MATAVGPAGATLSTQAVVVNIPADALTEDVAVAVTRLDATRIAALPAAAAPGIDGDVQLSSEVFAFTPHGTVFNKAVDMEITHTGSGNIVLRLDDEQDTTWEVVPGVIFEGGKARFSVTGFSVYAVASAPSCIPYATCAEAGGCDSVTANGCGGTMDCSNACTGGYQCFYVTDQWAHRSYYGCRLPCDACPPDYSICVDSVTWETQSTWCAAGGYCDGLVGRSTCHAGCSNGGCNP